MIAETARAVAVDTPVAHVAGAIDRPWLLRLSSDWTVAVDRVVADAEALCIALAGAAA